MTMSIKKKEDDSLIFPVGYLFDLYFNPVEVWASVTKHGAELFYMDESNTRQEFAMLNPQAIRTIAAMFEIKDGEINSDNVDDYFNDINLN